MDAIRNLIRNSEYLFSKKKVIGYIGWLGFKNLGDEVMYEAAKLAFSSAKVLPYKYSNKIIILEKVLRKRIFHKVMLGGGTLINNKDAKEHLERAQKLNYPTVVFGTGVRNPEFWDAIPGQQNDLRAWVPILEKSLLVGVRGPISRSLLEDFGCKKAEVIGDPALYFARGEIVKKTMRKRIGINVGISYGRMWGDESKILDIIVKFARIMIDDGWEIVFLPVWDQDLVYIQETVKKINRHVEIFTDYGSLSKTLNFLSSCDIFLGEKLHSVVLASCTYTPSIMLEYRPKCRDFMASLGLLKFNIRTNSLNLDQLRDLSQELYRNNHFWQEYLFSVVSSYKSKILDFAAKVNSLV